MEEKKTNRVGRVFAALGKSLCYLILFVGMQLVAQNVFAVAAGYQSAATGQEVDFPQLMVDNIVLLTLISGLLTLAFILAFYLIRRKKLGEALMLRPVPAPTLLTGASLAPALYLVVITVLSLLPEAWMEDYAAAEAARGLGGGTLVEVLSVAVVAPVVEEFVFRGLMMNRLSRVMPGWLAVVLSSAVFGVCHGQGVWIGYAFVLGLVQGFIALRAGSLWPSILCHLVFNAIGEIHSLIPETGLMIAWVVLLAVAIAAIILDRKAIAELFRPAPKQAVGESSNAAPPAP